MYFSILVTLVVVVVVVAVVRSKRGEKAENGVMIGLVSWVAGMLLLLIGVVIIDTNRDKDSGWTLTRESVYTVADKNGVSVEDDSVEFVAVMDGTTLPTELDNVQKVEYVGDGQQGTVILREEVRDVGTAIFPWGEGDTRSVVIIK